MKYREDAFLFDCEDDALVGIHTQPEQVIGRTGVVVVVGGPQYRVGSHRQFLELSRTLAIDGIPCMRFGYRGMGDSEGDSRSFYDVNEDIRAAVNEFLRRCPEINDVVLWGLCDGATAAAFYASKDHRISGLALLNPWVHTEQAKARVFLRHYYLRRLFSAALWRKIFVGEFSVARAARNGWRLLTKAAGGRPSATESVQNSDRSLPDQLYRSLATCDIKMLLLLSGKDYVAKEFESLTKNNRVWARLLDRASIHHFPDADHTFSDPRDAALAVNKTRHWILSAADNGN